MAHLQVTFGSDKVLFVNPKTEKAEGMPFIEQLDPQAAAVQLRKEVDGRGNVTRAALSILVEVLSTDRLNGYQGQTPVNEAISKEFKQAMREAESAYIRPLFIEGLPKSMAVGDKGKLADKYVAELWSGGVYALVKSTASQYFCVAGKLPCVYDEKGVPDHTRMLSIDAMKRLIQNYKEDNKPTEDGETVKDKYVRHIMKVAAEFNERTEQLPPSIEEIRMAVAALNTMKVAFDGMLTEATGEAVRVKAIAVSNIPQSAQRGATEAATVTGHVEAAIAKAKAPAKKVAKREAATA